MAGYALKKTSAHILARAVREVESGNTFLSPPIAKHLHHHFEKSPDWVALLKKRVVRLSSHEAEVLHLIAEGRASKQVAAELGISVKTIEKHRHLLMEKLDFHDTAGRTHCAIATGIIESSVQMRIVQPVNPEGFLPHSYSDRFASLLGATRFPPFNP